MFKRIVFPLMLVAVCILACSCFAGNGTNDTPQATTNPSPSPGQNNDATTTPQPANPNSGNNTGAQNQKNGTAPSGMTPGYDWTTGSDAVAGRIKMFSEINDCAIVENEGTALVGVVFADEYQGELTQRIRDMVAGEVMAADTGVQVVAVTSEKDDVEKIRQLSSQISSGQSPQDIKQQVDMIARNTTTLR